MCVVCFLPEDGGTDDGSFGEDGDFFAGRGWVERSLMGGSKGMRGMDFGG